MKRETEKRIEKLESKFSSQICNRSAFIHFVEPGEIDKPVAGWSFGEDADRVEIIRNEGESDTDLKSRAIVLSRKRFGESSVPRLISIG